MSGLLDGLSPHQRYRQSKGLLPAQWDRATPQDTAVTERAGLFPVGTYANGMTGLAWPGFIADPVSGWFSEATNPVPYLDRSEDERRQTAENAFNVAGAAMLGGIAAPKPAGNALGTFGGRLAKTADHAKLAQAEEMAARGVPREQIWSDTGWFQGPDKKWRFEIDDSKANFHDPIGSGDLRYKFEHRDLRQAYPDIQDARLSREESGAGGFYSAPYASKREAFAVNKGAEDPKATLLHEIQHGLQRREGFAEGTSPAQMGWSQYLAHAGEAEARLVENRMGLTADQRRARPPWLDYDVPEAIQIVRFGSDGPQSANPLYANGGRSGAATGTAVNALGASERPSLLNKLMSMFGKSPSEQPQTRPPSLYELAFPRDPVTGRLLGSDGKPMMPLRSEQATMEPPAPAYQVSPDLPMDQASRMGRARALGFNTDQRLFHGTTEDFQNFRRDTSDLNEISGNFLSTSPQESGIYAGSAFGEPGVGADGGRIFPVFTRIKNPARLDVNTNMPIDPSQRDALVAIQSAISEGGNTATEALRNAGFDGVEYHQKGNHIWSITFDPKDIRSTNAAFDPHLSDKNGLLYANGGRPGAATGTAVNALNDTPGIRAYHGSPHDFDKFDISKIGTGEGAQAYGHGLYFAENEGVAKNYRDNLSDMKMTDSSGRPYDHKNPNDNAATYILSSYGDRNQAYKRARVDAFQSPAGEWRDYFLAVADAIKNEKETKFGSHGRMYEVNIKANPEDFLDWDKPLSQQSEKVKAGIASTPWGEPYIQSSTLTGGQVVPRTNEGTKQLLEAGIPGIRYLDQGSRDAGKGTSNYVVFDPAIIEILRKYGLAGLTAGGAAAGVLGNGNALSGQPQQSHWSDRMQPGDM